MTPLKRAAAAFATSILLTVGAAALAAPAHADANVSVLNLVGASANGDVGVTGPGGATIVELPNVLSPLV